MKLKALVLIGLVFALSVVVNFDAHA